MNENHRDLISIGFTLSILLLACLIAYQFLLPLAWAGIIAIATQPVQRRLRIWLGHRPTLVASIMTILVTLVVAVPLTWIAVKAVHEAKFVLAFLQKANQVGIAEPAWISGVPLMGHHLHQWWEHYLSQPGQLGQLWSFNSHDSMKPLSSILKTVGVQVAHRSVIFGFAVLSLFFFYRDGENIAQHIDFTGQYCLGDRWRLYAQNLPLAITATVNGLVLVGLAVGVIMGVAYAIAGVPFPIFFGAMTGIFAMIPFAVSIAFAIVTLILLAKASFTAAIVILILGGAIIFFADHFVRPVIIGSATRLHFLAVLFGILGGVETLGLVGLFIGPVVMVLLTTLWRETELTVNP